MLPNSIAESTAGNQSQDTMLAIFQTESATADEESEVKLDLTFSQTSPGFYVSAVQVL